VIQATACLALVVTISGIPHLFGGFVRLVLSRLGLVVGLSYGCGLSFASLCGLFGDLSVGLVSACVSSLGSFVWGDHDWFGGLVRLVLSRLGLVVGGSSGCVLCFGSFLMFTLGVCLASALGGFLGRLVLGGVVP